MLILEVCNWKYSANYNFIEKKETFLDKFNKLLKNI